MPPRTRRIPEEMGGQGSIKEGQELDRVQKRVSFSIFLSWRP